MRSHMMTGLLRLLNRSLGLWLLPAFYVCFLLGGWQANDRDVKTEIQLPCKVDFGAASLYWRNPTLTFTLGRDNTHTLYTSCVLVIKNDVSLDFNQQRPKTKTGVMVLIKTSIELWQPRFLALYYSETPEWLHGKEKVNGNYIDKVQRRKWEKISVIGELSLQGL